MFGSWQKIGIKTKNSGLHPTRQATRLEAHRYRKANPCSFSKINFEQHVVIQQS